MVLEIRAGKDPANKHQISLYAYGERVENTRVLEAYNDHGKRRLIVEVEDGITLNSSGKVHSEVQQKSGASRGKADRSNTEVSDD